MNDHNEDFWNVLDALVDASGIVIDRPKGSAHPRFPDLIYRVDYGHLKNTVSMDGAGIDVWVGSGDRRADAVMCTVDLMKKDSEIKILIGCTEEEKTEICRMHNETQYMKGILIRRQIPADQDGEAGHTTVPQPRRMGLGRPDPKEAIGI